MLIYASDAQRGDILDVGKQINFEAEAKQMFGLFADADEMCYIIIYICHNIRVR